ncbi:MAG: GGDEF domain-containing protein [Eubacteriales bacterium]|nr:GGDEF domain-containing protein [Eubacteriales bacterium]MDD4104694.1 GGDEF domain-containing protein [Eubacteriales bacterium]MDD4710972.1 GGDEF domain-containing protein [Eubacteriales bacterium]NLO14916.1 GGDEF domain-containing protein [Clostridiales bacterium]
MPEKKKTICVIIGDISYDYTNELMQGMNEAAGQQKVELFYMTGKQKHIASLDSDKEREAVEYYNSIYDYIELVGADAFIISCGSLSGFSDSDQYRDFVERFKGKKHVVLHQEMDEAPGRATILVDNYTSVCRLTEHLINDHGYRKIAFISGPKNHPDGSVRERAYLDTMEKNGLTVAKGMLRHGDLSGFVAKEINQLLDDHPDLEALMFCNDEMVRTAYRVLSERGLRPGRDIAVTGFDDFTTGRTMSPPLTTIYQNAMQSGYLAVMTAKDMIEGKPTPIRFMKTKLHIRASCGCALGVAGSIFEEQAQSDEDYIGLVTGRIRDDLIQLYAQDSHTRLTKLINDIASCAAKAAQTAPYSPMNEVDITTCLESIMDQYGTIVAQIADYLHGSLVRAAGLELRPAGRRLYQVLLQMQGSLYAHEVRNAVKRHNHFRSQAWFAPEFIRDLVILGDEEDSIFRSALDRLRHIGLEKMYICLLPVPQRANRHMPSDDAGRLLLAAYQDGDVSVAYQRSKMPIYDKGSPLIGLPGLKGDEHLITFSIFSGDIQYGVLLCEAQRETLPILHIIGLQLGILVNFLDLKAKERIVLGELENTLERIEILSFLSEYDPLCNVYNRRGFIEQAIRLNRENEGKRAFCAFLDLDNLKKINDSFGHTAGDEAIVTVSAILKRAVRGKDLVARIGGDEFIVLVLADNADFAASFKSRLQDTFDRYNQASDKPYLISASIGITGFTCKPGLEIRKVIDLADQMLYTEKKRKSTDFQKEEKPSKQ